MPSIDSQQQAELARALARFEERLEYLLTRLRAERRYSAWAWQQGEGAGARAAILDILRATDYVDSQDPNDSRIQPGLVCASPDTLAAAAALNQAKAELDAAYQVLSKKHIRFVDPFTGTRRTVTQARYAMIEIGRGRFHYRQSVRRIVICRSRPQQLTFSWARASTRVRSLDRERILDMLRKRAEDGATQHLIDDIERIAALPAGEPLALVQRAYPNPRVHIRHGEDARQRLVPAVLPVFVPGAEGEPLPSFTPLPTTWQDRPIVRRRNRSGTRVDPEPFLSTLPVHRYLSNPSRGSTR